MSIRRAWWWAAARRRWCALALVAPALLVALGARVSVEHVARAQVPGAQAHALAHLLADFSHQPDVGSWSVVEDHSNYTTWRYVVTYSCGARCSGRALVAAHDDYAAPAHGARARRHSVTVARADCTRLPLAALLPWTTSCEETETTALVWAGSGGAWLAGQARARCGVVAALSGACAGRLRAHYDAHVTRVRAALALPHDTHAR